ncbi:type-F conjugative transfer system protein TraW [Ferrovum myxofaciens]|uniref:Type-F conjugative transfer system protein TraW n=1 Tax=Ferrovum myxofaciens TaxID=416213 RepID=A0A9E6SXV9_9PROT|nr:type-F conjugative transfer system protein TraW [Ferrovum myxofaciens]QKE37412.1 MAG: type-F conjugative transfer system protein TraW [Ferrovum myxofaciens]QWY75060.1 MAG: type-F conjugative transfer system protein TraW [Ferrovum myxofaciens]QWY77799.1 MAG: type-F conjugative transfer system protein TraW [Ferrovum myxofaciens]
MRINFFAILGLTLAFATNAGAKSLGVYGNVYDIAEPDMTVTIKNQIKDMQKDGSYDAIINKWKKHTLAKIEDPDPVPGITTTTEPRSWLIDPTFTEQHEVAYGGRVLVPKGFSYNPLKYGGLTHDYIFIDGRDQRQVDFAVHAFKQNPRNRIVLVAGSWTRLMRKEHFVIYYDQAGHLTSKFRITHVPAILSQFDGSRLKVEEILP